VHIQPVHCLNTGWLRTWAIARAAGAAGCAEVHGAVADGMTSSTISQHVCMSAALQHSASKGLCIRTISYASPCARLVLPFNLYS
jgi:hypothetical protein